MVDTLKTMETVFESVYQHPSDHAYFAPGRINLIGEHIDYNGGSVFPCAISQGTYALISKRNDTNVRFYSMNFENQEPLMLPLNTLSYQETHDWINYPKGMIQYMQEQYGNFEKGFDILYYGDIPNGAGLSSSASILVLTGVVLNHLYDLKVEMLEIVRMTQRVENEFMGVNTGIMDQYTIGFGKKDHALLLDTHIQEHVYVPVMLSNQSIVIMNTNKVRGLTDSKYNQRRSECERALVLLQTWYPIDALCKLTIDQLEDKESYFNDDRIAYHRARHAITENNRVHEAHQVLTHGDIRAFGKLMNASHQSLKADYEVTGIELDTLVDAAQAQEGCYGARVTGAGFGGCAIAIVDNDAIEVFKHTVQTIYRDRIGYDASFYIASVGDGAHVIR